MAGAKTECREACTHRVERKTNAECTEKSRHIMQRESHSQRDKADKEERCIYA